MMSKAPKIAMTPSGLERFSRPMMNSTKRRLFMPVNMRVAARQFKAKSIELGKDY